MEWTRRTVLFGRIVVVGAAVMTIAGLVLVERLSTTYEDGLLVAQDAALLVSDAVDPLSTLTADVGLLAGELAAGLDAARGVLDATQVVLTQVGTASSTNLAEMAGAAASISDRLAGLIEAIERLIPGDSESLAEDLRAFADGLEPLSEQLVDVGDQLLAAADDLDDADAALATLSVRIDAIVADIDALTPTFDALGVTADAVRMRAEDATTRLGLDLWLLRLIVVAGGAVVAVLGIVVERFARRLETIGSAPPG